MKTVLFYIGVFVLGITGNVAANAATSYKFEVTENGNIWATVAPSSADYSNKLYLVINGEKSEMFVDNKSSYWSKIDFGYFEKGDKVSFAAEVSNTGDIWWDNSLKNSDFMPHMQTLTTVERDYVFTGFEDMKFGGDMDFNDIGAYWTNVSVSPVPEPSTYLMLLAGLLLVYLSRKGGGGGCIGRGIGGSGRSV